MAPPAKNKNLIEPSLKEQLRALLQKKSIYRGEFTLASGAKSDFYVDARLTTLDPRGACLIGEVGWELVKETASKLGKRSEEHTSELQSPYDLVCRLLLEKKKKYKRSSSKVSEQRNKGPCLPTRRTSHRSR